MRVTWGNNDPVSARYAYPVRKICVPFWENPVSDVRKICVDNLLFGRDPVRCLWITSAEYAWTTSPLSRPPLMRALLGLRRRIPCGHRSRSAGAGLRRSGRASPAIMIAGAHISRTPVIHRPRDMRASAVSVREICALSGELSARYARRRPGCPQVMRGGELGVRKVCALRGCPRGMRATEGSARHARAVRKVCVDGPEVADSRETPWPCPAHVLWAGGRRPQDMRARIQGLSARYAHLPGRSRLGRDGLHTAGDLDEPSKIQCPSASPRVPLRRRPRIPTFSRVGHLSSGLDIDCPSDRLPGVDVMSSTSAIYARVVVARELLIRPLRIRY